MGRARGFKEGPFPRQSQSMQKCLRRRRIKQHRRPCHKVYKGCLLMLTILTNVSRCKFFETCRLCPSTDTFRFFDKNLPYVPIFDTKVNPDDCYRASPFLFWAIVTTGARKSENPTLILTLAPKVMDLAKLAIFASERYLPTIQALILMCTWPIPIDTLQKDKVPMLAGAMLQIATNMGLHVYGTAQDFTRVASRHDRRQRDFRTRLWALCLITCQR